MGKSKPSASLTNAVSPVNATGCGAAAAEMRGPRSSRGGSFAEAIATSIFLDVAVAGTGVASGFFGAAAATSVFFAGTGTLSIFFGGAAAIVSAFFGEADGAAATVA